MFSKKTKIIIGIFIVVSFIFITNIALATDGRNSLEVGARAAGYKSSGKDIFVNAQTVVSLVLGFVGFIFFGFVLYGGLRWMTSRGQDELKQKAKDAITNATIGLAIVVASYAITNFLFDFIGKKEGTVELEDVACIMDSECGSGACVNNVCIGQVMGGCCYYGSGFCVMTTPETCDTYTDGNYATGELCQPGCNR